MPCNGLRVSDNPAMALDTPATEPTPPPDRSRRIYVYWGLGLAFLAVLGILCWPALEPVLTELWEAMFAKPKPY
jgi:hypothetical protein